MDKFKAKYVRKMHAALKEISDSPFHWNLEGNTDIGEFKDMTLIEAYQHIQDKATQAIHDLEIDDLIND